TLRIIGENFAPKEKLDFYINDLKIDSFVSDEDGNFILSTKIPESQLADRADFIIKDQSGNQKLVSLRIGGASSRIIEDVVLTVNADSVYHRGDEKTISGTATPGSTLTISISDSEGQVLTTYTVKADGSGKYSTQDRVPSDRAFGEYTITITDGKDTVAHKYVLETTQKINLAPLKEKYEPGETVTINGTAIADTEIEVTIRDPVGMEVYSENIQVGANGTLTFNYPLDSAAREGTYVLFATQGTEFATVLLGVGQLPSSPLLATMDSLNYKTTENPKINIVGPPSATVSLIIIDPSDKQKFADSFSLGVDGYRTYTFNLTGYTSGVYTAVISRGNAHAENNFSVGLQTSTGPITLRTLQETYHPGESVLLIGDSNPNVIITISLTNPSGVKVKTQEVFTDKKGTFSSLVFRIPSNAQAGVWKLEAGSGINHVSKDLIVTQSAEGGITINLDKTNYKLDELVQINGRGASVSHTIIINILKSDQTEITKLSIVSTGIGSYSTIWKIPTDLAPGTYTIKVVDGTKSAETTFTVQ
ncbi:MAG: biofilm-associated protein, partial [Nitrosopumilaceae archaeon]